MAAVAVKANATIVHEDIPLVPATPLSPRETLNNQPSWEAIKALVERHPGWRASLREASPVEQERGLVFSVDVFFSVTAQAYRDTAASSVISGVSAESGIETACSGAEAASRAIPHGVKAFATRQKKRHNLANNSDDSPVKARVLHSFSPAAPVAGAWRAARREFEWPARATEHGGNEESSSKPSSNGAASSRSAGACKRKRDNRPTKTSRKQGAQGEWQVIVENATKEEADNALERERLLVFPSSNAQWSPSVWKPKYGFNNKQMRRLIYRCPFRGSANASCPAQMRLTEDVNHQWTLERNLRAHADHSISHKQRGLPKYIIYAATSPRDDRMSTGKVVQLVRKEKGATV